MAQITSMGALAAVPCPKDSKVAFMAILASIDKNFPSNWRNWQVYNYSFEDLFGGNRVPSEIEANLRFAIPTVDMTLAFYPSATSLSERSYKAIRTSILKWPLGRALLYAPHHLMEKIHSPSCDAFVNTVRELKPKFTKRMVLSRLEISSPSVPVKPSSSRKRSNGSQEQAFQVKRLSSMNRIHSAVPSETRVALSQDRNKHRIATLLGNQMILMKMMLNIQLKQNKMIQLILLKQQLNELRASKRCEEDNNSYCIPDSTQSD